MKKLTIAAVTAALTLPAFAQATFEEIAATPGKAGGVYYAYPVNTSENTPAPKGYEPFYISHYGRHGSRYLISDNDYEWVLKEFKKADKADALTPLGKDVLTRIDSVYKEANGRGGELSPLGQRQHRAIAKRMYAAYPQAFVKGADITARSTQVMRCAHSMFAFIESLKEENPSLVIPRESGKRDMYYLGYQSKESAKQNGQDKPWYQEWRKFRNELTQPDRLVNSLFSDSTYVRRYVDPVELMWGLYWIDVDMQNMETKVSFDDIFTPEELFNLWRVFNFNFYSRNSAYPLANGLHVDNAKHLAKNFLDIADEYIAGGKHGATLRFGHDGNIIPFTALMQFDNCYAGETDPYKLHEVYSDFKISPMASNVQMIFFRNKKTGDILVKFMLNERETHIPVHTDNFPFYRWSDVRPWMQSIIDTPWTEIAGKGK